MHDLRPDVQLQPVSQETPAEYPRRKQKKDRRPLFATALLVGGVVAFGASIFCFHYLEFLGFGAQPARFSGIAPAPTALYWPLWMQEEILGTESVQQEVRSEFWPWVLVLPLTMLAGAWLHRALRWSEKRDHVRQQRAQLGPLARSLDHGCDGQRAVLAGVLEVEGKMVERFDDGAQAAITAAATGANFGPYQVDPVTITHRAERLVLRMGDEKIPLPGDLSLLVGSREGMEVRSVDRLLPAVQDRLVAVDATAMTSLAGAHVSVRSIAPGDRVRVAGELQRAARSDEASHYRSSELRWQMIDVDEEGRHRPIEVVYEGTPRSGNGSTSLLFWTVVSTIVSISAVIATASP